MLREKQSRWVGAGIGMNHAISPVAPTNEIKPPVFGGKWSLAESKPGRGPRNMATKFKPWDPLTTFSGPLISGNKAWECLKWPNHHKFLDFFILTKFLILWNHIQVTPFFLNRHFDSLVYILFMSSTKLHVTYDKMHYLVLAILHFSISCI